MSAIEDAKFTQAVKFEEGKMAAQAAAAHYDIDKGTLALSGKEPACSCRTSSTEQIAVDAVTIDVTLEGPKLKASGNVRSTLKPASNKPAPRRTTSSCRRCSSRTRTCSSSPRDMDYDGTTSKGTYSGSARLIQGETSVKGDTIVESTTRPAPRRPRATSSP
jgi:lipopolysaccharide export system protein LptA